jgi:putative ABC transport system substrate-binding protein
MKKIYFILFFCILGTALFFYKPETKTKPMIGIIVPMEHAALSQIIAGFIEKMGDVDVKVLNAQADSSLQKSIIEQLIQERCDLLVPIGTQASQMTLHLTKEQNVLCLAANTDILPSKPRPHITVLDDECTVQKAFSLLTDLMPEIKKISLVHSTSDKIYKELHTLEEIANTKGIDIQRLAIHSLPDLYTIQGAIAQDSQAIFVLKDHLIVCGIATLVKQAAFKGIPVITSDDGSVSNGATLAIGIKESDIGREGGLVAKKILEGSAINHAVTLTGPLHLFINTKACSQAKIDLDLLINKASSLDLLIEKIEGEQQP